MILAQCNVALYRWPLTDPRMDQFVARVEATNELAENSPGFIWRYTDEFDFTTLPEPFNNPLLLFNMSVWQDVESLRRFVFQTEHVELIRRGTEWTIPATLAPLVMWWIDDAGRPTVEEAVAHLADLAQNGPAAAGFAFQPSRPAPGRGDLKRCN